MVSMSRQLLADSNWLQKVKDGRVDEIKSAVIVIRSVQMLYKHALSLDVY